MLYIEGVDKPYVEYKVLDRGIKDVYDKGELTHVTLVVPEDYIIK